MNAMVGALSFKAGQAVITPLFPPAALKEHLKGMDAPKPASPPSAELQVQPVADPFASLHDRVMALQDAIENGDSTEDEKDDMMAEWARIDAEALAGRPTTLGGGLGALLRARRELVEFQMGGVEETKDPSRRLLLHLVDGVIGVLRQESVNKAA